MYKACELFFINLQFWLSVKLATWWQWWSYLCDLKWQFTSSVLNHLAVHSKSWPLTPCFRNSKQQEVKNTTSKGLLKIWPTIVLCKTGVFKINGRTEIYKTWESNGKSWCQQQGQCTNSVWAWWRRAEETKLGDLDPERIPWSQS